MQIVNMFKFQNTKYTSEVDNLFLTQSMTHLSGGTIQCWCVCHGFEGSVIAIPFHEGEARGRGQLSSIIPMLPWYNYFIIRSTNWFPGNKEKSSTGMISYPEDI